MAGAAAFAQINRTGGLRAIACRPALSGSSEDVQLPVVETWNFYVHRVSRPVDRLKV